MGDAIGGLILGLILMGALAAWANRDYTFPETAYRELAATCEMHGLKPSKVNDAVERLDAFKCSK